MIAVAENPVLTRELRSRLRGVRVPVVQTIYLVVLAGVFLAAWYEHRGEDTSRLGRMLFEWLAVGQGLVLAFCAPAFAAGALSGEREQQTLESLLATPLRSGQILRGKLLASVMMVGQLLLLSLPLQAVCFLFGGVSPSEFVGVFAIQAATGLLLAACALGFSTICRATGVAVLLTYLTTIAILTILPAWSYPRGPFSAVGVVVAPSAVGGTWPLYGHAVPVWVTSCLALLLACAWIIDATGCWLRDHRDGTVSTRPRVWLFGAVTISALALVGGSGLGRPEAYTLSLLAGMWVAWLTCPFDADSRRPMRWCAVWRNHPDTALGFVALVAAAMGFVLLGCWPTRLLPDGVAAVVVLLTSTMAGALMLRCLSAARTGRWATLILGGGLWASLLGLSFACWDLGSQRGWTDIAWRWSPAAAVELLEDAPISLAPAAAVQLALLAVFAVIRLRQRRAGWLETA